MLRYNQQRNASNAMGYALLIALFAVPTVQAATLPSTLGWYQIPNTTFQSVQASNIGQYGVEGPAEVVTAWSSGASDINNNRMLLWGGGHTDYWGNEVYELDLNALSVSRLTMPSAIPSNFVCSDTMPDGNPPSRHTYDSLTYIPNVGMFAYSGALAPCGGQSSQYVWTFNPSIANPNSSTPGWTNQNPMGGPPGAGADTSAVYDPNTGNVFVNETSSSDGWIVLWEYSHSNNTWTKLNGSENVGVPGSGYIKGVIDPGRKMLFFLGDSVFAAVDISGNDPAYTIQNWSSQVNGCGALSGATAPGLTYDSVQKLIVGWAGGNTVYLFNPGTVAAVTTQYGSVAPQSCLAVNTYSGGPPSPLVGAGSTGQQANGTYGRFAYFPNLGVFAVVNDWNSNAYTLRLTNGTTPPPPPPPTNSPCDVNGDGQVNVADVQKEVTMALQLSPCTNLSNQCTVIQVEDVVNAVLGGQCVSP